MLSEPELMLPNGSTKPSYGLVHPSLRNAIPRYCRVWGPEQPHSMIQDGAQRIIPFSPPLTIFAV